MSRGDWDAALAEADPNLESLPPDRSPSATSIRGASAVKRWVEDQRQTVGDMWVDVDDLIEVGGMIVALITLRVRPKKTDAELHLRIAHLWTLCDDAPVRCQVFSEREEALRAAGLSTPD